MPTSLIRTKEDERLWDKAKERAQEQGKAENWAYVMGIYKRMNPDRFDKEASLVSRVAEAHLSRRGYDEKGRDPDEGWQHGQVEPFQPTDGEGSQTPPVRDNQGAPLAPPDLGRLDVPGYEWHDTSKAFHAMVEKVAGSARKAGEDWLDTERASAFAKAVAQEIEKRGGQARVRGNKIVVPKLVLRSTGGTMSRIEVTIYEGSWSHDPVVNGYFGGRNPLPLGDMNGPPVRLGWDDAGKVVDLMEEGFVWVLSFQGRNAGASALDINDAVREFIKESLQLRLQLRDRVVKVLEANQFSTRSVHVDVERGKVSVQGTFEDTRDMYRSRDEVEGAFTAMFGSLGQISGHSPSWTFYMGDWYGL